MVVTVIIHCTFIFFFFFWLRKVGARLTSHFYSRTLPETMSETETFHVVDDAVDAQNESADLSVDVRIAHFY